MLRFRKLTEPERAIWHSVETGALVRLPLRNPTDDDPAAGAEWGEDRQVRGQLLYELLAGGNGPKDDRPRALKLAGARITGTLDLEAATLVCPLWLRRCFFDQPINLREVQAPSVGLPGCHAPGLAGGQLQTRGDLNLEGFAARGEINLVGARIGGAFRFDGAHLHNPGGDALQATRMTVEGSMFCRDDFTAHGAVWLMGARIGVVLAFTGASLNNPGGLALMAGRLTAVQGMHCRDGFSADGEINLHSAHIGGVLFFDDARLTNPGGYALQANGVIIDGSMSCTEGFTAHGKVSLVLARIARRLDFRGARLHNRDGLQGLALDLEAAHTPELYLLPKEAPDATVELINAQVGSFHDDPTTWPAKLLLRGFTYDRLENDSVGVRDRLRWLAKDPGGYLPQLYEQLAGTYRKAGRGEDARKVAIAKQRHRRQTLNPAGKAWSSLLRWTVGYGYQTWKAGIWLLALVALGWWVFDLAHPAHLAAAEPPGQRPWFNAGLYALDLLVPFADLGYQSAWIPSEWASWCYVAWNLAGWVLVSAVVAGPVRSDQARLNSLPRYAT